MKKIFTAMMVCAALVVASCAGGGDKPEQVADAFMKAYVVNMDFNEMQKYTDEAGTAEVQEDITQMDQMAEFATMLIEQIKNQKLEFTMNEVVIDEAGTTATVTYTIASKANPDLATENGEVTLVQGEDKKWKVNRWDIELDNFLGK